jgi:PAS domain-containing protein
MDPTPATHRQTGQASQGALPRAELWLIGFYLLAGLFVFVFAERTLTGWLGGEAAGDEDASHQLTAKGIAFVLASGAILFGVLHGTRTGRRVARPPSGAEMERFEWVARAATDAMWDWDLSRNRVWRSEGYYGLLGCRAPDLAASIEAWIDRLHPDDQDRVVTGLRQAMRSGQTQWTAEYRLRTQDGGHLRVIDRACVLRNELGEPARVIGGLTRYPDR